MRRRKRQAWVAGLALLALSGCALLERRKSPASPRPAEKVSLLVCLASVEPQEGYKRMADEYGEAVYVAPEALLTERDVAGATALHGEQRSVIILEFKLMAAARLEQATARHVGERLAVFVDDEYVVSALIRGPVVGGQLCLDVGFSRARADEIVQGVMKGE